MSDDFSIPEPRLEQLQNHTPLVVFQCDKMGVGRQFFDVVVAKGTYVLAAGELELAPEQDRIALNDEVWDPSRAEVSSLRRAGELVLTKPKTDVTVAGTARVEAPLTEWDVRVAVARGAAVLAEHRLRVTGPRRWIRKDDTWELTAPEAVDAVPIRYELAYGGAFENEETEGSPWVMYEPNPSGTGFLSPEDARTRDELRAPQWLDPQVPLTTPDQQLPLAGLGPVARPWESRLGFAGTYDDAWKARAVDEIAKGIPPDYAADFDPQFFQCAHPALITEHLQGGEEITLEGLAPGGPLQLRLPTRRVVADLFDGSGEATEEPLALDTVHIDLDAQRVHLCWRLTLDQARDVRAARLMVWEGS